MDPIDEIARAQTAQLVDEDGDAIELDLERGLSDAGVDAFEDELGVALPGELRDLLAYTTGFSGVLDSVDFTGRSYDVQVAEIFPAGLPIAGDGFGNFWVADLTPQRRDVVAVFFACHDPAVILLQSPSIGHFLHEVFRTYVPPHASLVNDVHADRLFDVWRENPGVLARADALIGGDGALQDFAATLDDDFEIVDLRSAEIGMGFSWGRHGPRTEVRRHGHELLFAYRRAPRTRRGLRGLRR
jgi:cell wall assembly regulator SMI1